MAKRRSTGSDDGMPVPDGELDDLLVASSVQVIEDSMANLIREFGEFKINMMKKIQSGIRHFKL